MRASVVVILTAALIALTGCAATAPNPVLTLPPAAPAPAAIPTGWSETEVPLPGVDGTATYTAPQRPERRLRAALVLGDSDTGSEVATKEIAVMLAHSGIASLRYRRALTDARDFGTARDRAGRALSALADTSALDDDRLLVVGHGATASLVMALAAGRTGRPPRPIGMIEPVFSAALAGTPDPLQAASDMAAEQSRTLGERTHNLLTCSDADIAVDCGAVQNVADVLIGTHVNFVRLRGVSFALQEDRSRDPGRYGAADLPFSAMLNASVGTWASMQ